MSIVLVRVFKDGDGWFVATDRTMGPYPRELAESLAKGIAFAIKSSGGEPRIRHEAGGQGPAWDQDD